MDQMISRSIVHISESVFHPAKNHKMGRQDSLQTSSCSKQNIKTKSQFILTLLSIAKVIHQSERICKCLQQADLEVVEASKIFADKTKTLQLSSQFCEVFTAASSHAEPNIFHPSPVTVSSTLTWLKLGRIA